VTIYSSEMSPPQYRGMLNLLFQWCTTIGIIIAQVCHSPASPPPTLYFHGYSPRFNKFLSSSCSSPPPHPPTLTPTDIHLTL